MTQLNMSKSINAKLRALIVFNQRRMSLIEDGFRVVSSVDFYGRSVCVLLGSNNRRRVMLILEGQTITQKSNGTVVYQETFK